MESPLVSNCASFRVLSGHCLRVALSHCCTAHPLHVHHQLSLKPPEGCLHGTMHSAARKQCPCLSNTGGVPEELNNVYCPPRRFPGTVAAALLRLDGLVAAAPQRLLET